MAHCTFRGDEELDPFLRKWSDKDEKSFHIRQALRNYIYGQQSPARQFAFKQIEFEFEYEEPKVPEQISFDEWR